MQVTIDLEHLIELLNELRAAGFDVSTQQYISAQDLLVALAANGQLPEDPRSLRTLLAPIVCSTPREQENFYRYFERWVKRNPQATIPVTPDTSQAVLEVERKRDRSWLKSTGKPVFIATSIVLAMGLVIAGVYYLLSRRTVTLTGKVFDSESRSPLGGATISFAGQAISSDQNGQFSITYRKNKLPVELTVENDRYESVTQTVTVNTPLPLEFGLLGLPIPPETTTESPPETTTPPKKVSGPKPQSLPTPVTITLIPLPSPSPTAPATRSIGTKTGYTSAILPFLLFGLWWVWKTRLSRGFLQKLQRVTEPRMDQLLVRGGAGQLFQGASFRRTIQELRRHRRRGANELDAPRTVSRTIERGGLFTPAYGSRQALPEYLILIDRASFADQQARLNDEIVRRFVQDNVFVDTYHFQGDPRLCRKQDKNSPYYSLQEIATLHPDHHLIVFSDGSTFINPLTGETERWLEMFASWTSRALLTPESPAHWGHRERALAELDFIVLPATKEGLASLTELLGGGVGTRSESDGRARPYPSMLRDRTMRWLENHEPSPETARRLCDQLKVFLGTKGYQWLSACAVYPLLHWDLTLYLGFKLFRDRGQLEDRLLSLVRLLWFRYGSIPDWLRLRLISDLSRADETSVRKALEDLLLTVMQQPAQGIRLDIATEQKESLGLSEKLKKRFARWKLRRAFWQFMKDEPPESPLRDFVFLSFMSGRRPKKLTVSVPDTIRKFIFPQGQVALGMRPASLLVLAIVAAVGVGFINWRATKAETSTPPQKMPFFYSQMSWQQREQFIGDKAKEISGRLGNGTSGLSYDGLTLIKNRVDEYAQRVGNGNNEPTYLKEDLLQVFGRGIPYAPALSNAFQKHKLSPLLGLYLAMTESEYRVDEETDIFGAMSRSSTDVSMTAEELAYDLAMCDVRRADSNNIMLITLFCPYIKKYSLLLALESAPELTDGSALPLLFGTSRRPLVRWVSAFFAAAIVGENPGSFRMQMKALSAYGSSGLESSPPLIDDLISQFSGPERRNASDQLVEMYSQNKTEVIDALINAILDEGPNTYRVNLYIARTLGMISPGWEGTSEHLARLQALTATRNYRDRTFKYWVDRSIARFISPTPVSSPSPSPSPSASPTVSPQPSPSPSASPPLSGFRLKLLVNNRQPNVGDPVIFVANLVQSVLPIQYRFIFGDGSSTGWQGSNESTHSYSRPGTYLARVEAQAFFNGRMVQVGTGPGVYQINVGRDVRNAPVTLRAQPSRITAGQTIAFSAQVQALAAVEYAFDFGDGSRTDWLSSPQTSHQYSSAGSFAASVSFRETRSGQLVSQGSTTIRVVVSPNTDPVIPNLVGLSGQEATKKALDYGFVLGKRSEIGRDPSVRTSSGTVISQRPGAGSRAPKGTKIDIVVEYGPPREQ